MKPERRAHGVTPDLNRDYATRTAEQQARFVLPFLRPGMTLLDVGCGPGTITAGLAAAVKPGEVLGIDHDDAHVEAATALAADEGLDTLRFISGNALALPCDDRTFDVVFENNVLIHLGHAAPQSIQEAGRVLVPGGIFAARDTDATATVWSDPAPWSERLDRWMRAWQEHRGSDLTLGRRLPALLREAGFVDTVKSVSADTRGDPAAVRSHADITLSLLNGPLGSYIVDAGLGDRDAIERTKDAVLRWRDDPDAFFANVHIEVIGRKPG